MIKQFLKPTVGKVVFTLFSVIFIWSQGVDFFRLPYWIILCYFFWSLILLIYVRLHINDIVNNNFFYTLSLIFSAAFFLIGNMPSGNAIRDKGVSYFLLFFGIGGYIGKFIHKKTNLNYKEKAIRYLLRLILLATLGIIIFIDTTAAVSQFIAASLIGLLLGISIGFEEEKLRKLLNSTSF